MEIGMTPEYANGEPLPVGEIPEDANEHCPGPEAETAGKVDACEGCPNQQICATAPKGPDPDLIAIAEQMAIVKHTILVLSGKGGVDEAVIWRGPHKNGLIKHFLKDVYWGELDYLVVDAPPGTSDEHISIAQYLKATIVDGVLIVTTPHEVLIIDARKEINFCKKVALPVLGVVENMSGIQQPISSFIFKKIVGDDKEEDVTKETLKNLRMHSLHLLSLFASTEIFHVSGGGAEKMATEMHIPFLGKVPIDPELSKATEEGCLGFTNPNCKPSASALQRIIKSLLKMIEP